MKPAEYIGEIDVSSRTPGDVCALMADLSRSDRIALTYVRVVDEIRLELARRPRRGDKR